jgi:hypothetical protein
MIRNICAKCDGWSRVANRLATLALYDRYDGNEARHIEFPPAKLPHLYHLQMYASTHECYPRIVLHVAVLYHWDFGGIVAIGAFYA